MNEAIMEEQAKQSGGDILVLGVNLRHCRPHDLLGVGARTPIEVVIETGSDRIGVEGILDGRQGDEGRRLRVNQTVFAGRRRRRETHKEFLWVDSGV